MGEAILLKIIEDPDAGKVATEGVYTGTTVYYCTKNGNYRITCVGGGQGGAGSYVTITGSYGTQVRGSYGGVSGQVVSNIVALKADTSYVITVGAGGERGEDDYRNWYSGNGGITSFGSLMSSSGGFTALNNGRNGGALYINEQTGYVQNTVTSIPLSYGNGGQGSRWYTYTDRWGDEMVEYYNDSTNGSNGCVIVNYVGK